jgi:hypothetical protein
MATQDHQPGPPPASFPATRTALETIQRAVRTAQNPQPGPPASPGASAEQALAALLLLRQLRDRLGSWEAGLIETARDAGASWADLAHPLGVANRQSAERRYLRLRPGPPGTTGEQRIQATRDRRAGDRAVATWARENAADLRQLAGQVTAVPDLPDRARTPLLHALGGNDAAGLLDPLAATRDHLAVDHPRLAADVDALATRTDHLRRTSDHQRRPTT